MNPEQAYRKLCEDKNHKDRESLERIISEEADASYCYAIAVKQCRWELGEAAISTSAYYSYHYAVEIIGGRFVLGEAAISTSAEMSFFYSRWAIQGRLPDIMHRKMLAFGIMDSSDEWVKEYFATVAGVDPLGRRYDIERKNTKPRHSSISASSNQVPYFYYPLSPNFQLGGRHCSPKEHGSSGW